MKVIACYYVIMFFLFHLKNNTKFIVAFFMSLQSQHFKTTLNIRSIVNTIYSVSEKSLDILSNSYPVRTQCLNVYTNVRL